MLKTTQKGRSRVVSQENGHEGPVKEHDSDASVGHSRHGYVLLAPADVKARENDGSTKLHPTIVKAEVARVMLLGHGGVDESAKNIFGSLTPFSCSCWRHEVDTSRHSPIWCKCDNSGKKDDGTSWIVT
jgi:hypothetical protein